MSNVWYIFTKSDNIFISVDFRCIFCRNLLLILKRTWLLTMYQNALNILTIYTNAIQILSLCIAYAYLIILKSPKLAYKNQINKHFRQCNVLNGIQNFTLRKEARNVQCNNQNQKPSHFFVFLTCLH